MNITLLCSFALTLQQLMRSSGTRRLAKIVNN
jgi:hypothetical protein